jgi:hypothetical protein
MKVYSIKRFKSSVSNQDIVLCIALQLETQGSKTLRSNQEKVSGSWGGYDKSVRQI